MMKFDPISEEQTGQRRTGTEQFCNLQELLFELFFRHSQGAYAQFSVYNRVKTVSLFVATESMQ